MSFFKELKSKISDFGLYWNIPMPGRYMTFKEIFAYAGGGIGAYFIIQLGSTLIVSTTNMIVGGAIGVAPTDIYILYIISTLANIPLTAVRATMIDNTRNKAGKYRPYLLSMGIPTALIALAYVWFPYDQMKAAMPNPFMNGSDITWGYIAVCGVVLIFNLLLQFFFNFFNDAYTNLIHVLSPNTQERTDVLSIKAVVYSLAPSIMNIALPIVAQYVSDNDLYDIKVYRISYPIFAVFGIILTTFVYGNTKEKIVQAKTHAIQISFIDAFKQVAKNKYFWIIALAGWLGFLESAYGSVLDWTYSYAHACSGTTMSIIRTIVSNAALWGMILAPFCIRTWGKKKVLLSVNFMNVVCILAMLIDPINIYWIAVCVYLNWLFGAFEQITTPAIQADIRDYHQYVTGERVDGMFATVQTIGNLVTLVTSSVLPMVYKSFGIYEGNGYAKPYDILDITTGEPGLLERVLSALILMAGAGAFLNMVPYFFYDLDEKRQNSIVRVLKIRAVFEDYGNGIIDDAKLVEGIDIINNAKKYINEHPKTVDKKSYKAIKDREKRKLAKIEYKNALIYNEEIDMAKFIFDELNKFSSQLYSIQIKANEAVLNEGLKGLFDADINEINAELHSAKALPKETESEKELRKALIDIAKKKKASYKAIKKYYPTLESFVRPDFDVLEKYFNKEDECDEKLKALYLNLKDAKKNKNSSLVADLKDEIKKIELEKKIVQADSKAEMDKHARFNRAAKPYIDAEKLISQKESYTHLDDILLLYDEAKTRYEAKQEAEMADALRKQKEKDDMTARLKAEKAAAKSAKRNK